MNNKYTLLFPLAAAAALLAVTAWPSRAAARGADDVQAVTLTTGDGARLSARYFPGNKVANSPAVIVLDDVGDDARPAVCDDIARQLAKEGCTVLCFDFRGCGRSKSVEPEFWDNSTNQQLVKGYKADDLPEQIQFNDFKLGYLPALVNDVAAARAHLERRNDARECNSGQTYLIGYGRGATIGQLWVASEWSRYRVAGTQNKVSANRRGATSPGASGSARNWRSTVEASRCSICSNDRWRGRVRSWAWSTTPRTPRACGSRSSARTRST